MAICSSEGKHSRLFSHLSSEPHLPFPLPPGKASPNILAPAFLAGIPDAGGLILGGQHNAGACFVLKKKFIDADEIVCLGS